MRDNVFLVVDHTGSAYWSDTPSSSRSRHSITEEQLVTHVEYLIDNIYVNIGNKVFRQCGDSDGYRLCATISKFVFIFL